MPRGKKDMAKYSAMTPSGTHQHPSSKVSHLRRLLERIALFLLLYDVTQIVPRWLRHSCHPAPQAILILCNYPLGPGGRGRSR